MDQIMKTGPLVLTLVTVFFAEMSSLCAEDGLGAKTTQSWTDGKEAALRYASPAWKAQWSDEFEKEGLPDSSKWTYEHGMVRNEEIQFYTRKRKENARIEKGHLIITARKEPWENEQYTSASLTTQDRFAMLHGKIEFKAKVPRGRGTWPALWMVGVDMEKKGWPACGEIDVMEYVGWQPGLFHFTVHTTSFNHEIKTQKGTRKNVGEADGDFHLFGLLWSPEKLEWFYDGEKVFEFKNTGKGRDDWPFDQPHYLIVNLAMGGSWGGAKGVDDAVFPAEFLVNYVRVWK